MNDQSVPGVIAFDINKDSRSPLTYTTPSSRWKAVTTRDARATNAFVYAVVTTRIYCRPDCRARLARRANVVFYDNNSEAEHNGFRACKRCKPNSHPISTPLRPEHESPLGTLTSRPAATEPLPPNADADDVRTKIYRAVQLIRQSALEGQQLSLAQLSQEVGLSKWHLQRVFKRLQGVTPREMAEQMIDMQANESTTGDHTVTWTSYNQGMIEVEYDGQSRTSLDPSATSGSSSEGILTPVNWLEGSMPTVINEHASLDVDVENLLKDLFPELCGDDQIIDPIVELS
ncbi:uncharacterized protein Z518_08871 [Rhinocladiella mackenziei CBS 650.93]|uniref:HTH araC/xylS-type domain-containing protein n=1 Tax=Rhinocladiella mackenziei CBS 650.93 TaxID=1442369 RepID=A0A0D2GXN2_9EURO|nr:uncharacterized protein Z518_08871 [Rhinocladiella mackenziei CBS 650.93]KIX02928.1 hypothetical protein Z518_08871 [Rhinocladiella mackenziei CBS 650.93]